MPFISSYFHAIAEYDLSMKPADNYASFLLARAELHLLAPLLSLLKVLHLTSKKGKSCEILAQSASVSGLECIPTLLDAGSAWVPFVLLPIVYVRMSIASVVIWIGIFIIRRERNLLICGTYLYRAIIFVVIT